VFFTGDNGTGGDGKGQPTELGARVPMIVNCPGLVKPLGAVDELMDLSDVLPTLADFAGASVPKDRPIDGRSFAPLLRGQKHDSREWAFAYIGEWRILRTRRWLLERNTAKQFGRLYDCGTRRDGRGYKEVTDSTDPEVLAVRKKFEQILKKLPPPDVSADKRPAGGRKRKKRREKGKAAR